MDHLLSAAVIAHVGEVGRLDQTSPEQRVAAKVGDAAPALLPAVEGVLRSVDDAEPPFWTLGSLPTIGRAVVEHLATAYPELSDEARAAVAARYTFDWQ